MPPTGRFFIKATILAIVILVGGPVAFEVHSWHSVESFCKDIGESDTSQKIVDRALAMKLFYTRWQGKDDIWILNRPLEDPPMFRIACAVTFKDGKPYTKEVVDAD